MGSKNHTGINCFLLTELHCEIPDVSLPEIIKKLPISVHAQIMQSIATVGIHRFLYQLSKNCGENPCVCILSRRQLT